MGEQKNLMKLFNTKKIIRKHEQEKPPTIESYLVEPADMNELSEMDKRRLKRRQSSAAAPEACPRASEHALKVHPILKKEDRVIKDKDNNYKRIRVDESQRKKKALKKSILKTADPSQKEATQEPSEQGSIGSAT